MKRRASGHNRGRAPVGVDVGQPSKVMEFYEQLGFRDHPFAHTNADEEPLLEHYFVPPPFFAGVIGDPAHPTPTIVLAPRGAGKSAQRRQLELWCASNAVLAVTYDRFEFGAGQTLAEVSLPYHIRNILTRVLITYLSYLSEWPDLLRNVSKDEKRLLSIFAHSYLGDLTGLRLQEILNDSKSLPQKFRKFWSDHVGVLESVVNVLLRNYGLETIDLPDLRQEEKRLAETYKHQLEVLASLVQRIGFRSIYILIDKADESEKTGNDAEATYLLLRPLLTDLELLALKGYGFKFFVWDQILPYFRKDARPDRVTQHTLTWTRNTLETVLSKRLRAFSDQRISSFSSLLASDPGYQVDAVICLLANRSPRNVIRMCDKILAVQAELDATAIKITPQAIERGIDMYCAQVSEELYGADVAKDLQRAGRELFTINYLASEVFKTAHENTSRNRVGAWQNAGLVKQVGSVAVSEARRPLNFYYVADPAMVRLIHRAIPLEQFVKDRWIPCSHCGADNLMNIELVPDKNDALCHECGRNLL